MLGVPLRGTFEPRLTVSRKRNDSGLPTPDVQAPQRARAQPRA
jgi:hypothetical protein